MSPRLRYCMSRYVADSQLIIRYWVNIVSCHAMQYDSTPHGDIAQCGVAMRATHTWTQTVSFQELHELLCRIALDQIEPCHVIPWVRSLIRYKRSAAFPFGNQLMGRARQTQPTSRSMSVYMCIYYIDISGHVRSTRWDYVILKSCLGGEWQSCGSCMGSEHWELLCIFVLGRPSS